MERYFCYTCGKSLASLTEAHECNPLSREEIIQAAKDFGAQAALNLLGRSATSEGHPPRVWHDIQKIGDAAIHFGVSCEEWGGVMSFSFEEENDYTEEYLSLSEHQALRAADLLEIKNWKLNYDHCPQLKDAALMELSQECEARKLDSAEISELTRKGESLCNQNGTLLIEIHAERERNARLTAALEKIAAPLPDNEVPDLQDQDEEASLKWAAAARKRRELAKEALAEAGKHDEPHPRGYCDKCGLPLRRMEDFPLLCTCMLGDSDRIVRLRAALRLIAVFEPWKVENYPGCGSSEYSMSSYKSHIAEAALVKDER